VNPDLPPAAVPPAAYDEQYYLNLCLGYEEWRESGGARMAGIYPGVLARAGLRAGEVVVDIGAGRGELVVAATELGATAVGIEYSEAAVELSRRTLAAHGDPAGARVELADARALPLPDADADLVTMLDVIEHLTPREQAAVLREALRVLRPGGRILVHTFPNRLLYDVTYRVQRTLRPRRWKTWPRDPRRDYEHEMHVGEHSARSLRRALAAAGFVALRVTHGEMMWVGHVPDERARVTYARLAAHRLTEALGRADIWGEARAPATPRR
jgi:SAM-dependent methyltransferase